MSKKIRKQSVAALTSAVLVAFLLAGCGANGSSGTSSNSSGTSKPTAGGKIVIDANQNMQHLDPALGYDNESWEAEYEMYDQLVTYKQNTSTITGKLAKSWTVSADGKTYTFHLRNDAKFWNGNQVTAQSFIDEFQRVLNAKLGSPAEGFLDPIVQGASAYNQNKATSVSGLGAPDAYTLQITLTKPEPFFLYVLAMPFFSAVDANHIKNATDKAFDTTSPMGSGPFEMKSFTPSSIVLVKNPHYWDTDQYGNHLPYLDQVSIRFNTNSHLDVMNYQTGQTAFLGNTMNGLPSSDFPTFVSNPQWKKDVVSLPQNATNYIGLNTSMKPFNNVLVRQALEYAIDKKKIVQLMNNRFQVANQPLPPGIAGYVKNLPADAQYTYNPEKAKQLLAQAGFPHGFTTTFYSPNDSDSVKIDQSIQNDLANVGVTAKIEAIDLNQFLNANEKGNVTPIYLLEWIQDFPDPSDFLNTLFNSTERPLNNSSMYSNPQVDGWLNQAQTDLNPTERLALYDKATEQIMKDAPWVPLNNPVLYYAVHPWVHNFYISPVLPDPLQYIWIDESHSQGS